MRILAVCVWIIGGAVMVDNRDIIGGTIILVIGAAVFWWDTTERAEAARIEKSEQERQEGENS